MRSDTLRARLARRVVVVLVEPLKPGNVGAAARALRNTGLERLVLVAPPAFDPHRARWMAPGCDDLLRQMRIVDTLDEALVGVHRVVATTARHRRGRQPVWSPATFAEGVLDTDEDLVTAILFGREDFGLPREAVDRCHALIRIPTPEHASLNLAQAVLLIGHALFTAANDRGMEASGRSIGGSRGSASTRSLSRPDARDAVADLGRMEPAVDALVSLLERVGYTRGADPSKVALTARSALQNATPTVRQIEALRGMIARVEWALDHPEADPRQGRSTR